MMQNNTILTTVVCSSQVFHTTTKLPITLSSQLSFTLGRGIATFSKVNADFWCRQVTATVCSSNITVLLLILRNSHSENIVFQD
jgi:hypothetical protein